MVRRTAQLALEHTAQLALAKARHRVELAGGYLDTGRRHGKKLGEWGLCWDFYGNRLFPPVGTWVIATRTFHRYDGGRIPCGNPNHAAVLGLTCVLQRLHK